LGLGNLDADQVLIQGLPRRTSNVQVVDASLGQFYFHVAILVRLYDDLVRQHYSSVMEAWVTCHQKTEDDPTYWSSRSIEDFSTDPAQPLYRRRRMLNKISPFDIEDIAGS